MTENTKIEWADHTFNPWVGCTKISPACDHCYAESWAKRAGSPELWKGERRRTTAANWEKPRKWNYNNPRAVENWRPQRVFCASLADVFDNQVPEQWRLDLWDLIETTPRLDWLLLTKRPQNIEAMRVPYWVPKLQNVWLGTTIESRNIGASRAWQLAQCAAPRRFWSAEPLLEDLGDLTPLCLRDIAPDGRPAVDWVIVGGESGPGRRPFNPDWARSIRDQCAAARVPFFMKQIDKKIPIPDDLMIRQFPGYYE